LSPSENKYVDPYDIRTAQIETVKKVSNKHLPTIILDKLHEGTNAVSAIGDYVGMLLGLMGVENWNELKRLGIMEIFSRGIRALQNTGLIEHEAGVVGEALGKMVGTFILQSKIVPERIKKDSGGLLTRGHKDAKIVKDLLADGNLRVLWRFILALFEQIVDLSKRDFLYTTNITKIIEIK
jgi:hypothetical protein